MALSEKPTRRPVPPEEGSGVRETKGHLPVQETRKLMGLSDEALSRRLGEKVETWEEDYPQSPWEEVAPATETDVAKAWGVTEEELDREDEAA